MRLLFIHSDHLEYEARSPVGDIAEPIEGERTHRFEESLVVFVTVEKEDAGHGKGLVMRVVDEVADVMHQVDAPQVVLYPWAHLSSDLASAEESIPLLKEIEDELALRDVIVHRAAFGWYKSFTLNCKGHPLAELARHIGFESIGEMGVSKAVYDEEKTRSTFHILTPEGDLFETDSFNYEGHPDLETFVHHETKKDRTSKGEAAHIQLMQRHELVDYEPGSDAGNLRWYPKGKLMKILLEHLIRDLAHRAGAMEMETPQMYDYDHPSLKKYMERFPARQYIVLSDKKRYFLRFAACFGQFLAATEMNISYKNLPLRLFEITRQSFRREKSGEVMALRRLRSFTMPDLHTFCGDVPLAKEEFFYQFELSMEWMRALDVPYEAAYRSQTEFFHEHRDWYERMVRTLGRPVLLELFEERYAYFITKFEFNVVDTQGKAGAISTVQIDVENSELYGIEYTKADGTKANPIILHTSISGAIERCLYAILEHQALRMERGEKGEYPLWLAPTQVRFVPVGEAHIEPCMELAAVLDDVARADVDDRGEKVGKKIRTAETEWVPITIVYGDKEAGTGGLLPVRLRSGEERTMTIEELKLFLEEELEGYPFEPVPLPVRLSDRPSFRS
jgi:threonyl-tRNA synthetase